MFSQDTTNPRRGVYRIPYPMPTSQSPHHHFRHNVKYRNFPLISYDVKTGQTRLRNYSHFIDDRFKRNATKSCLFSARLLFFLSFLCMVLFVWVYIAFIETRFLIRDSVMDLDPGTWEMQAEQDTTKQHIMRPIKKQTNKTMRKSSLFV